MHLDPGEVFPAPLFLLHVHFMYVAYDALEQCIMRAGRRPPGAEATSAGAPLDPALPLLSVSLKGHQDAVQPQSGYQWNRKAFSLLYQLFQMTVAAVPPSGPAITISK